MGLVSNLPTPAKGGGVRVVQEIINRGWDGMRWDGQRETFSNG